MGILVWIIATIAGAILYRMGGSGKYNTKARDIGVPLVGIALLVFLGGWNWWLILCFGLYFGSMTTYYDFMNKWFGQPEDDKKWFNWLAVGIGFSLSFLPYTIVTGHWIGFTIRTIITSLGVMIWSEIQGNAVWEECGRGAITTMTIPLLLI